MSTYDIKFIMENNNKFNILVVDDELSARYSAKYTLESFCDVDTAENVSEALKKINEKQYNAILLDLFIGTETEGIYALEEINSKYPEIAVIIMSGSVKWMQNWNVLKDKGAKAYLSKPFSHNMAEDYVRRVINGESIDPSYL